MVSSRVIDKLKKLYCHCKNLTCAAGSSKIAETGVAPIKMAACEGWFLRPIRMPTFQKTSKHDFKNHH